MFDLFELFLWQYTDTNEWIWQWTLCLYNKLKEEIHKDVKPAAVMNHSTLEGVIHFYDHKMATAGTF